MESIKVYNNNITSFLVATGWEDTETTTTNKDTFMEEVESYTIFKIADFINIYWFSVLIPIGLVGNTLSFIVMIKPNNRKMSTCIYMAAISINDNIMMYVSCHDYLVSALQIHKWKPFECKFVAFAALFALQNCTFQVLAMTVDKYIAIKWPHRAATYSTPRRARIIAGGLYVSVSIYNIPHFFLSSVIGGQCLNFGIKSVITSVYSWFSFVLNAVIPFTMLIHMNFVILKAVRKSRKMFKPDEGTTRRGRDQGMDTRRKTMKNAENQLTIMLLLVTTLFLILLCPTYFRFIYLVFASRDTPLDYAKSMFIYQITAKLYISNSGINFFLYCISGQKFRNDLKDLLSCCGNRHPHGTGRNDGPRSARSATTEISTVHTKSSTSPEQQEVASTIQLILPMVFGYGQKL